SLSDMINLQIRSDGPISVATYMALCLTHPRQGYYKKADPLGAAGDFITAPEISQMFGELIGFFFVNLWQQMQEPKRFTLLELGPGRGSLMSDLLRVATRATGFAEALDLRLLETNPQLAAEQKRRLAQYAPKWIENFDDLGEGPLLIVANEFFDALPIRQFVKGQDGWHERMVGLDGDKRIFGLSPTPIPEASLPPAVHTAAEGEVYEAAMVGTGLMTRLAKTIAARGGAILAIDYGYAFTQTGETLQAVRRHGYADPLAEPGEADLSAHVDFGALSEAAHAAGLKVNPVTDQGDFLRALGIAERAQALSKANPKLAETINAALARLTAPDQMGELFKVFCAQSPGLQPPGLDQ
ncbi:MAG: methyltransferase, partial [Hyphomicrobiales bacterium]|nr:methyltransferase [Hyphomicrobiales bacterium]